MTAGDTTKLERTFPSDPKASIGKGSEATLQVGLWGLAADGDDRRAVRKLFNVKMIVDSGTPQAVISAPQD